MDVQLVQPKNLTSASEKARQKKLSVPNSVARALYKRMLELEPIFVKIKEPKKTVPNEGSVWVVYKTDTTLSSPSQIVGVTLPSEEEALRLGRIMKIVAIRNTINEAHDMGRKSPDFIAKLILRTDLDKIRDMINDTIGKAQETLKQAKQ